VHNDDFIGIASYNIFVGISVATIFGAAFFFDLFWPERAESVPVRLAWKICSVVVSIMALADVLALTVRWLSLPVLWRTDGNVAWSDDHTLGHCCKESSVYNGCLAGARTYPLPPKRSTNSYISEECILCYISGAIVARRSRDIC
jgi:hypothetical protein